MTAMAKVRLLAVLTMDGCPAETTSLCGQWLGSDKYGIGALKEDAICILKEDTSLTLLSNRTEQTDDSLNYLIEATEKTAGIINGMMRMRLVDEIIRETAAGCFRAHCPKANGHARRANGGKTT
mgnify:CR=1 FL=1